MPPIRNIVTPLEDQLPVLWATVYINFLKDEFTRPLCPPLITGKSYQDPLVPLTVSIPLLKDIRFTAKVSQGILLTKSSLQSHSPLSMWNMKIGTSVSVIFLWKSVAWSSISPLDRASTAKYFSQLSIRKKFMPQKGNGNSSRSHFSGNAWDSP